MTERTPLFDGLSEQIDIWNSHGDRLTALPAGFRAIAKTENSAFAAIENPEKKLYALQFHPEVSHTPRGKEILQNFVFHICHCSMDWTMGSFIEEACEACDGRLAMKSGARFERRVDSSVAAALLHKAIGDQLTCIL